MDNRHFIIAIPGLFAGRNLDRGQYIRKPIRVFVNKKGSSVIDLLLSMNYIVESPKRLSRNSSHLFVCDNCGAEFVQERFRILHKQKSTCISRMEPQKEDIAKALSIDLDKLKFETLSDVNPPMERLPF